MSNASPSITPCDRPSSGMFRMLRFESPGWRKTISRSGLPEEAQALVRSVVKKIKVDAF